MAEPAAGRAPGPAGGGEAPGCAGAELRATGASATRRPTGGGLIGLQLDFWVWVKIKPPGYGPQV